MNHTSLIEGLYLLTGVILPLFYIPQIRSIQHDKTGLSSYSMSKSTAQMLLRLPTLAFAFLVVQSSYMNIVLSLDVLGRIVEWAVAIHSLKKQGFASQEIAGRLVPFLRNLTYSRAMAQPDSLTAGADEQVNLAEKNLVAAHVTTADKTAKAPVAWWTK